MRPIAPSPLDDLVRRPTDQGVTLALVVVRGGEVVAEWYGTEPANDFADERRVDADTTLISWSMAKSITHAAVGILVADGLLDPAAPAPVPEWEGTDKAAITLDHLLQMRSGLRFVEDYVDGDVSHCIDMLFSGEHPSFGAYAASLPLDHEPGSVFNYSSGTTNIVTRIVGDVVAGGPGGDPADRRAAIERFLDERLFAPVGMRTATAKFDDGGDFVGSSYVYATARDFARFGELYLHDGVTDGGRGERILPAGWRDLGREPISHDADAGKGYGRHWWLWPAFPGSMVCHGYEGQVVAVLPDRDLVVVHLGKTSIDHQRGLEMWLARLIESSGSGW